MVKRQPGSAGAGHGRGTQALNLGRWGENSGAGLVSGPGR